MRESSTGPNLRRFSEDAQHFAFWIRLLGAVALAVFGATSLAWWSYVWKLEPPLIVAVGLASVASILAVVYAVTVAGHVYFGFPKRNPLTGARTFERVTSADVPIDVRDTFENGICRLAVTNLGPTDDFSVTVPYAFPVHQDPGFPVILRWRGHAVEKRHIFEGHTETIEVLRVAHTKSPEMPADGRRFNIEGLFLLTPQGELPLSVIAGSHLRLNISLKIGRPSIGKYESYTYVVFVATDGRHSPAVETVIYKDS